MSLPKLLLTNPTFLQNLLFHPPNPAHHPLMNRTLTNHVRITQPTNLSMFGNPLKFQIPCLIVRLQLLEGISRIMDRVKVLVRQWKRDSVSMRANSRPCRKSIRLPIKVSIILTQETSVDQSYVQINISQARDKVKSLTTSTDQSPTPTAYTTALQNTNLVSIQTISVSRESCLETRTPSITTIKPSKKRSRQGEKF